MTFEQYKENLISYCESWFTEEVGGHNYYNYFKDSIQSEFENTVIQELYESHQDHTIEWAAHIFQETYVHFFIKDLLIDVETLTFKSYLKPIKSILFQILLKITDQTGKRCFVERIWYENRMWKGTLKKID